MKTITDISNDANELQTALTAELLELSKVPAIDFDKYGISQDLLDSISESVEPVSNESLTTTEVGGSGTFDILMKSVSNHLLGEFEAGRISGAEYTRAYIELTGTAMASSIEFLLNRDQARWTAITAQIQASTALVHQDVTLQELDIKRVESELVRVNYATEKAKLAQLHIAINISEKELALLEEQVTQVKAQTEQINKQTEKLDEDINLVVGQVQQLSEQTTSLIVERELTTEQIAQTIKTVERTSKEIELMDSQLLQSVEQLDLIKEQVEAARGQTAATRRDGQPIVGVIGSQVDLQKQQKITFQKDMELKAAKVFSDAWTVMKSIDEGLTPPDSFSNENVDRILRTIA